ncbi:unnamed protein product [Strongylus vulgaris]|uniref:Uncharacterized protein n=1 Tax=Strongylus vulgaris TaxID=40348 RepID=A0A3P7K008_STRVU|nr:unnamed protein product [Strongylus vulgaris]
MVCCTKSDLKNMESRDYYRDSTMPIIPNRQNFEENTYINYPPRSQELIPTQISQSISAFNTALDQQATYQNPMVRSREQYLPPPIITSKVELDRLEEKARRQAMAMGPPSTSSRNPDSDYATGGVSSESPGPSISAQIAASRFMAPVDCHPPLPELDENLRSGSLRWPETQDDSTIFEDDNDDDDDDDDEDYFG